ncbi:MAG TPA: hypothetical protein DCM05_10005 [Elusimicrobia bacterium]|nr:hypothetical protein [Elusimicrobiota bacterium]
MPPARVRAIELASVVEGPEPGSGECEVLVALEDGRASRFAVATPDRPGLWMSESGQDSVFRLPVLYVARFDDALVCEAVKTMAADLGGYWLRYYNAVAAPPPKPVELAAASVRDVEGPLEKCCAVFEVMLKDARQFSILAATPDWFAGAMAALKLKCYFGSQVLFMRKADEGTAKRAAKRMAEAGERWLCLYDTPRTTLPKVLEAFKAKHP